MKDQDLKIAKQVARSIEGLCHHSEPDGVLDFEIKDAPGAQPKRRVTVHARDMFKFMDYLKDLERPDLAALMGE